MILPIVAYGDIVLKQRALEIAESDQVAELIEDMWQTMYNANGVGLAAPQINKSLRLFIVDTLQLEEKKGDFNDGIKQAFINAKIEEYKGDLVKYEEGCLSMPDINADVERQDEITITYLDENFAAHTKTFTGFNARVIQHEFDHIEGVLFTDRVAPLKKKMLKKKLDKISKGKITAKYKMKFPSA